MQECNEEGSRQKWKFSVGARNLRESPFNAECAEDDAVKPRRVGRAVEQASIYEQAVVKPSAAAGSERDTSKHLSGIASQPACHLTYQRSAFIQENEVHNGLMLTYGVRPFIPSAAILARQHSIMMSLAFPATFPRYATLPPSPEANDAQRR